MFRHLRRGLTLSLLVLTGCLHPVAEKIDATVCELAMKPHDLQPISHLHDPPPPPPKPDDGKKDPAPATPEQRPSPNGIQPIGHRQPETDDAAGDRKKDDGSAPFRLDVPADLLPGGPVPPLRLPPASDDNEAARRKAIGQLYPELPTVGDEPPLPPGPKGLPLTLSDLQQLALTNHPRIKQAAAQIEEARGRAIQAGLPPNPIVGYEGDTTGTTGGAGYQGGFVQQTIKTANKLQLARAAAAVEIKNAELALVATRNEVATSVRTNYFAFLVAAESVRLSRALIKLTTEIYQVQVEQVRRGGFAAPYEPMYLRALATEARAGLVRARNRRTAAWKQLAAALGLPGMPPVQLAGRLDVPVPAFCYKDVLARVLAHHTDVLTAANTITQAQYQLELERITPIPDVDVRVMVQKDRTGLPFQASPSVAVSVPVPVWDKNQGGILEGQARLIRAKEGVHRARTELTNNLAEAFERYENSKVLLGYYRDRILPDLVRVFRGVYDRYQREPAAAGGSPPGFTDVVVAQQNLAQAVGNYVTTLGQLWQATADIAGLLQTPDLYGVEGPRHDVPPIPDLHALPPLPCCHPCSPLHDAHHHVHDAFWPNADALSPALVPHAKDRQPSDDGAKKKDESPAPNGKGERNDQPPPKDDGAKVTGVPLPPLGQR
ncbi:MAG: TolC family protein [Gemmataceae bacterium]